MRIDRPLGGEIGSLFMGKRFVGRVVIVTGASGGIGRDTAMLFAREGAKVILAARSVEKLNALAAAIKDEGGSALVVPTDVSVRTQAQSMVEKAVEAFGRVDILVNNAGVGLYGRVESLTDDGCREVFATNLFGPLYCIQAVLTHMRKVGAGQIVNVSSVAGKRAMPNIGAYAMTKFGLQALSESLRVELAGTGVEVITICPGLVRTDFPIHAITAGGARPAFSMRSRRMTPGRAAQEILKACEKHRREVVLTLGGRALLWINHWFPRLTDWIVSRVAPLLEEKQRA